MAYHIYEIEDGYPRSTIRSIGTAPSLKEAVEKLTNYITHRGFDFVVSAEFDGEHGYDILIKTGSGMRQFAVDKED